MPVLAIHDIVSATSLVFSSVTMWQQCIHLPVLSGHTDLHVRAKFAPMM